MQSIAVMFDKENQLVTGAFQASMRNVAYKVMVSCRTENAIAPVSDLYTNILTVYMYMYIFSCNL